MHLIRKPAREKAQNLKNAMCCSINCRLLQARILNWIFPKNNFNIDGEILFQHQVAQNGIRQQIEALSVRNNTDGYLGVLASLY